MKKGDLLISEVLKVVLALMGIAVLVVLSVGLTNIFMKKSQYEQAKETLNQIIDKIELLEEGQTTEFLVTSPKDWYLAFFSSEINRDIYQDPPEDFSTSDLLCICPRDTFLTPPDLYDCSRQRGVCREVDNLNIYPSPRWIGGSEYELRGIALEIKTIYLLKKDGFSHIEQNKGESVFNAEEEITLPDDLLNLLLKFKPQQESLSFSESVLLFEGIGDPYFERVVGEYLDKFSLKQRVVIFYTLYYLEPSKQRVSYTGNTAGYLIDSLEGIDVNSIEYTNRENGLLESAFGGEKLSGIIGEYDDGRRWIIEMRFANYEPK